MKPKPLFFLLFLICGLNLSAQTNSCVENIFNKEYQNLLGSSADYQTYLSKYQEMLSKTTRCDKANDSLNAVVRTSSLSTDDKTTFYDFLHSSRNEYADDVYKRVQGMESDRVARLNALIPLTYIYELDKEYANTIPLIKELASWGNRLCKFSYGNPLSYYDANKQLVADSVFQNEISLYHFKKGEIIADIGAGSGYFERALSKYSDQLTVYVTEISASLSAQLKTKLLLLDSTDKKSIVYIPVLSAEQSSGLPLKSFDKILIRNTVHHFSQPDSTLQQIKASLKKGGRLYIVDIMLNETKGTPACGQHWTRKIFLDYMQKNGFVLLKETPLQYDEFILFEFSVAK